MPMRRGLSAAKTLEASRLRARLPSRTSFFMVRLPHYGWRPAAWQGEPVRNGFARQKQMPPGLAGMGMEWVAGWGS
ncbi:hypothetical protein Pres01_18170 [Metapseudomonas resinovorans]|nr:hypothetical protein Pres01_18170 [Pseudomonas resinovorans]